MRDRVLDRANRWLTYAIEVQVVTAFLLGIGLLFGFVENLAYGLTAGFLFANMMVSFAYGGLLRIREPVPLVLFAVISTWMHWFVALLYVVADEPMGPLFLVMCGTGIFFVALGRQELSRPHSNSAA